MSDTSDDDTSSDTTDTTNSLADELDGLHDDVTTLNTRVSDIGTQVVELDKRYATAKATQWRRSLTLITLSFAVGWLASFRFDSRCVSSRDIHRVA